MSEPVRFLLGFEEREVHDADPNMTVLQWLRTRAHQPGTKEGCAEGDCGACTVVLAEPDDDGRLRYRAVNACILFLPAVHGKQLIAVEHLREDDGTLHPAQQAMVDCHGSQCGFCTPGFVMSLFALFHNEDRPDRQRIQDVLAGNLCRCTGYRPIIDAAQRMYELGRGDRFASAETDTARRLDALRGDGTLAVSGSGRAYYAPRTVDALADLLADLPDATIVAGGTDVGLWVTKQHRRLETLVATGEVAEMKTIVEGPEVIDIGGAATHSDAMDVLGRHYPDFGELLRRFASVQIRNSGTLGGNIANASPIGDSMPVLITLDTELVLRRGREQRTLPMDQFFLDYRRTALQPGEFVERIRVPVASGDWQLRCYKLSKRFDQDISAVCAAFNLRLADGVVQDIRIGFGGMAAVPVRARQTEEVLRGQPWSDDTVAAAERALEAEFSPLTDMRASAGYRMLSARNLLRKCYLETTNSSAPTRVLEHEEALV
ncbi:xanthine dehydrogenase small subunit [Aquisalimonas lutea]|uniref:xanthine dehydrogenase small subunit n=1 Tax=Aquisalimonas lutea TaxID=1327750 RepID=UPI0025B5D0D1|nr:xanthine dehydrogenase small subunit [Aquisalimonas lutea]MDN3518132.1 xanthine dehydrogenase small subunit [Aquisalimonas lutea]